MLKTLSTILIIVLVIVAATVLFLVVKTSGAKGNGDFGEWVVNHELSKFPAEKYILLSDVALRNGKGMVQIDHVLLSAYGIFVIETKNYHGMIAGSDKSENWSRVYRNKKYPFYSPVRQNYGHMKALAACRE